MKDVRKITPKNRSEIDVQRTWTPLARSMEDFFENFLPRRWMETFEPSAGRRPFVDFDIAEPVGPRFDMVDHDEELMVRFELPGVSKEDITIAIAGEYLTVEAKRQFEEEEKTEKFFRSELGTGKLIRTLLLPVEVEVDKVKAALKDGLLTITLPKVRVVKRHLVKVA